MARDYAIVTPQFWTGTTGREIRARGRDAQLVALYLMTSPHANMLGPLLPPPAVPLARDRDPLGRGFEGP